MVMYERMISVKANYGQIYMIVRCFFRVKLPDQRLIRRSDDRTSHFPRSFD